jgi:Flp pilus assembly protein TadG
MNIKNQNGGSLVEFVIIAPLLFIILFGIIEFGILLYNQAVLTNASREGARYGIVARTPRYSAANISANVVIPYCSRLITFGTQANPSVTAIPLDGTTLFGDNLEVLVSWDYTFLVLPNFPGVGLTNPINLSARSVMKYE